MRQNSPHNKDQMHPQDFKNLILFLVLAGAFYLSYDHFIVKPQKDALREAQKIEQQAAVNTPATSAALPEEFLERGPALEASSQRIALENPAIDGSINLRGGRIDDVSLRTYYETLEHKKEVSVLSPRGMKFSRTVDMGWIPAESTVRVPDKDSIWQVSGNEKLAPDSPVTLRWDNGQGLIFTREIALDTQYMFSIKQSVTNQTGASVTLFPYGLVSQRGVPPDFQGRYMSFEGPIGFLDGTLLQKDYKGLRKDRSFKVEGQDGWLGITDKYWLTSFIPPRGEDLKFSYSFSGADKKDKDNQGLYQIDYLGEGRTIGAGETVSSDVNLFVGAKRVFLLEQYEDKHDIAQFDLSVDFGWFWFMTKPFFFALHYLGEWTGNMGVAIIILTIILRMAVFPLTNISYRSFAKMKKVGPQVTELRKTYGEDKQKLQQEMIALYQKEGVNPMSGCFPMLLQIPIFFALYKTFFVTIELRHAPFFGWIHDLTAPDPTSIFNLFGLIPWTPPAVLMIGVWPCLMLVAMLLQKQLNPPPQDPLQRDMAMYLPFMFCYMMSHFASGLVVYWTFSAFIGLAQQIIIMKSMNVPIHLFGETEEDKALKAAVDKGPAVHPLTEMVEDDIEDAMFGEHEGDKPKDITKPKPKKSKKKK